MIHGTNKITGDLVDASVARARARATGLDHGFGGIGWFHQSWLITTEKRAVV